MRVELHLIFGLQKTFIGAPQVCFRFQMLPRFENGATVVEN